MMAGYARSGRAPSFEAPRQVNKTTVSAKPAEINRQWFVIDAENQTLGNVATECARRLRGKHKAIYTPHVDTGDYIVVINAEKVVLTGEKASKKVYRRFTGYIGNLKETSFERMIESRPERVIEIAVKGMLPKNPLGRDMFRKLRVYRGPTHNHAAQQPVALEIRPSTHVGRVARADAPAPEAAPAAG